MKEPAGAIRNPAVAGQFYPRSPRELDGLVRRLTRDDAGKARAVAAIVPHAGYVYSGAVAGEVFSRLELPERHLIFCPNHSGIGSAAAVAARGSWRMPWGDVPVDEGLAARLLAGVPLLAEDPSAHAGEHSLEVQLPFIRRFRPSFRFVPVALGRLSLAECREIGEAVAEVVGDETDRPLLLASSDMTHYEPDRAARRKDDKAIARILALDPEGLYRTVRAEGITMCGVIPATIVLFAARALGATSARLVKYATSGEVSGDYEHVVGYAGVTIH